MSFRRLSRFTPMSQAMLQRIQQGPKYCVVRRLADLGLTFVLSLCIFGWIVFRLQQGGPALTAATARSVHTATDAAVVAAFARERTDDLVVVTLVGLLLAYTGVVVFRRKHLLQNIEKHLLRSQEVLTDTLENMGQGIFMVDGDRRIAVINRRALELLGLPPDVGPGSCLDDILALQLQNGEFANDATIRELAEAGGIQMTDSIYERERPNGTVVEVRTRLLSHDRAVRVITDITERKQAEARITYLAHHDGLTGLANRALFHERLAHAIATGRRIGAGFAVLCLDLDRFKLINDTYGHDVGDRLLAMVAERLRGSIRDCDTAARFGGDEFAILQAMADQPEAADALAQRLVAQLSEPYEFGGSHLVIGVSLGIALYPADGTNAGQLLKSADIALYKAKGDGRGKACFFEPEMDRRLQERYALEHDLAEAIAADRLEVHYQPICAAASGIPIAYEALARWTHPVRGVVSPDVFIPVAEDSGLIGALGCNVLRAACREAARWPPDLRLTVNLSPRQFLDPGLAGQVLDILDETGLDPGRLGLEVTEGLLIRNGENALDVMRTLQRRGVRMYLDDFGTGHAGLSYLLRFPFDCIKIDRSFVARLAADGAAQAIVRAIVLLSESLNIEVVAEGVESGTQFQLLRELGCRQVQGFLFGIPKPGCELPEQQAALAFTP